MSKIRISLGALEIEYEGDQAFIEERLLDFVSSASELMDLRQATGVSGASVAQSDYNNDLSTNTIAQIISVKTGSELALAAIAKINLVKKQPAARRQDILDEMREASTYFRETYSSNLSAYLDTLVKGKRINLISKGTYALAAGERQRLEAALASGA